MLKKLLIFIIFLLSISLVNAQTLNIGVKEAPPFVIIEDNEVSGFSIDLIEELVNNLDGNYEIKYHIDKDLNSHFESIKGKEVDFGIAATTITSAREKEMDFSHSFYESSLGVMIRKESNKDWIVKTLLNKQVLTIILGLALYMIICGHILWIIERKGKESSFDKRYGKGVVKGMWWTIVTMSTVGYGDVYPRKPMGKLFGTFVIISGILFFGFAIAVLSSSMTLNQLALDIEGPSDLVGEKVAVIKNTNSVGAAKSMGLSAVQVDNLDQGKNLLLNRKVNGVVYDAPLIQYYLLNQDSNSLTLAQETFKPSPYGITFPKDSKLTEEINVALLKIQEEGFVGELEKEWFGNI